MWKRLLGFTICLLCFGVVYTDTNLKSLRQAIPVAVVQGGALAGSGKKDIKNETTLICNSTYQNCADSLIRQAKFDRKLKKVNSPFNVTESAYNSSVAGALDNNKATVLHNKTIHIIRDMSDLKPNTANVVKPLNKTMPSIKTINVSAPTGNNMTTKEIENSFLKEPAFNRINNSFNNLTIEAMVTNKTNYVPTLSIPVSNNTKNKIFNQTGSFVLSNFVSNNTGNKALFNATDSSSQTMPVSNNTEYKTFPHQFESQFNRNLTNDIILTNNTDNNGFNITMPSLSKQNVILPTFNLYATFYNSTRLTSPTNNTTSKEVLNNRENNSQMTVLTNNASLDGLLNNKENITQRTNQSGLDFTDKNLVKQEQLNTSKRAQLMLPSHATNIYLLWLADKIHTMRKEDKAESKDDHGILVGPLDDLPDHPNGNGPQDRKTKDLEGSYNTDPVGKKGSKHKKKRPKRATYNFDIIGTPHDHTYNYLSSHPDTYDDEVQKPFDFAQHQPLITKLYDLTRNPKQVIAQHSDTWDKNVPRYDLSQQYYTGAIDDYDKMLKQEISNLDRNTIPKVGTTYPNDGIDTPHVPIGTPSMAGVYHDNSLQNILEQHLSESAPTNTQPNIEPFLDVIKKANEKNVEGTFPYSTEFSPENLDTRGAIPTSGFAEMERKDRDKQIQSLLNTYDLQTKQIANLYKKIISHMTPQNNVEARSLGPQHERFPDNQYQEEQTYHENLPDQEAEFRSAMPYPEKESEAYPEKLSEISEHAEQERYHNYIPDTDGHAIEGVPYPYPEQLRDPDSDFQRRNNEYHNFHDENPYYRNFHRDMQQRDGYDKPFGEEKEIYRQEEEDDVLKRRNLFPPTYEENFQDEIMPRDQVPNNGIMRNNIVKEFLKMYAHQNRIPPEDNVRNNIETTPYQNAMFPNVNLPVNRMNSFQNSDGYVPIRPASAFFPPRTNGNPIQGITVPRSRTAPLFNQFAPQQIQSAIQGESMVNMGQQPIPSPQQAAVMTNMGTPATMSFNQMGQDQVRNNIAGQQGIVMLMVTTPTNTDNENSDENRNGRKEIVKHKELTHDGIKRTSSNVTDDERDFSINLKKAANFVLNNAVKEGNISLIQRAEIERKLNRLLDQRYKNKTRGEIRAQTRAEIPRAWNGTCMDTRHDCAQFKAGGVCPFMRTFMKGTCTKTCNDCPEDNLKGVTAAKLYDYILKKGASIKFSTAADFLANIKGVAKSHTPTVTVQRKIDLKTPKIPVDPVMYLSFDNVTADGVVNDNSGNNNKALLEKGAAMSPRILGTCGKAIELNEGSVSWSGDTFKRKPDSAISIAMWVKVKKSGVINWFANGKKGDKTFYAKSKGTAVPAKVWTHVAGTFDSNTGLARIYINGDLEEELQQRKGAKLAKNWLVNGIGSTFGDDSLHYVDEVMIYDRALTNSEVRMLFNRCMFNRMVLHFGFQKGNKTNINDQSGLENNGILIGGATQKSNCDRCGACLDLTEGPDPTMRIQQVSEKNLPKIKLSITAWISLNSTRGVHNIFTTESSEGNIGYRLQVVNGRIRWAIGTDTVPVLFDNMTTSVVIPEALWTHIIVSYNNENGLIKIYANGLLKFKDNVPEYKREYLPTNWDNDASIGDATLKGYIDEFIMYNWELDDSEALYVRNYCADHPKLVRFTVRVPLTKKTIVPRAQQTALRQNWWDVYTKFARQKMLRAKKGTTEKATKNVALTPSNSFTLLKRKRRSSEV